MAARPIHEPLARDTQPGPRSGGARRSRRGQEIEALAEALSRDPELRDGLTHWKKLPARPGRTCEFPARLHPRLRELYAKRGVTELYEHQLTAIDAALKGEDVLVATPTASGKTLAYVLPVLQRLLESGGNSRAIMLHPTKALSQDQTAGLTSLMAELGEDWHAFTYDGDTPPSVRRTLRDRGHVILTNPFMLHAGILPHHAKWSELFRDLEFIVIDEVHTLSGVFGSSVANVLRRLLRIARHYGSNPRFLCSSATLKDPAAHARRLLGRDVTVITEDASPAGEKLFGLYNPPLLDPVAGLRANALEESRKLARVLCGPDHQTLFFCNRRTSVEVLTRYLKENAKELGLSPDEIRGYRGGYLPLLRREIEAGLREGRVKVVVSTNALELGIDVGQMDVCVLVGYPGSQASFWQRAGRVGRRGKPSLCVLIARSDPVDQYLAHHPDWLFGPPRERLAIDPDNLVLLSEQLKCAAFELPFTPEELSDESAPFGVAQHVAEILDYLTEESGLLFERKGTYYWMADVYPAQDVSLLSEDIDNVLVLEVETEKAVGEIDRPSSLTTVHDGAIYQVEGKTWIVERFDHKNRRAYVREVETDYFTEAQTDVDVRVLRLEEKCARSRAEAPVADPIRLPTPSGEPGAALPQSGEDVGLFIGEVHVTTLATQFKKIRYYTRENVGADDIHLPPEELDTETFVLTLASDTATELGLTGGSRGSAWRGVGQILRRVAPLHLRCGPSDLGLSSQVRSPHFGRPALFLFDRVQGGVGLAAKFFEEARQIFASAHDVLSRCACRRGCPACVGTEAEVGGLGKETALRVIGHLIAGARFREVEIDEDDAQGQGAENEGAENEGAENEGAENEGAGERTQ